MLMIEFVETELTKLASEMEADNATEGTSITDLIVAADTAEDKVVFDEVDPALVEAMKEHEPEEQPTVIEIVEEVKPEPEHVEIKVEVPEVKESPVANIFSDEAEHRSPAHDTESMADITDFRPTIVLMGTGRGYYNLPY